MGDLIAILTAEETPGCWRRYDDEFGGPLKLVLVAPDYKLPADAEILEPSAAESWYKARTLGREATERIYDEDVLESIKLRLEVAHLMTPADRAATGCDITLNTDEVAALDKSSPVKGLRMSPERSLAAMTEARSCRLLSTVELETIRNKTLDDSRT